MASFLWRHKWKTFLGVTIGVGTGLYYNREYIFQKIGQAVADYSKGMVENIKKEEEQKSTEEHFEKIQTRCLGHTLQFLRALREHLSVTLDVRPTLKLLKKATEDKDLEQKVVYWKTLLDLKLPGLYAAHWLYASWIHHFVYSLAYYTESLENGRRKQLRCP